jgi:phenylacetate-CoA ligase
MHAGRAVPYYRELFSQLDFRPEGVTAISDLRALPILTKTAVRTQADALRIERARPFWITETSGSTGTPLTIELNAHAYRLSMALLAKHESDHGISPSDRRATFAGRLVQAVEKDEAPFWRYNWAEHQMLCSAYHMSDRNLPAYLSALERFRPVELIGYPSALYLLADFCRRKAIRPDLPLRAIVTNSETLFDWQRSTIEQQFNTAISDYYGSAESVVFAPQCHRGTYHPDPLMGVCEVIDDAGFPVAAGASGRLICTTTSNYHMPLIRYEIGDSVVTLDGECTCGIRGAAWRTVLGRNDDLVITPEGHSVGRLDHVFKGASGIREAQICQTAADRLVLRIVPDKDYQSAVGELLVRNTAERVGRMMRIEIKLVETIERTPRGKFRGVVREF